MLYALIYLLMPAVVVGALWTLRWRRPTSRKASALILGVAIAAAMILFVAPNIGLAERPVPIGLLLALLLFFSPTFVLMWLGGVIFIVLGGRGWPALFGALAIAGGVAWMGWLLLLLRSHTL